MSDTNRVEVAAVVRGEGVDVPLKPDDILFVPSSGGKKAAFRTLEAMLGMGTSIGTGAAIYRH